MDGNWIIDMENTISVNHFQLKIILGMPTKQRCFQKVLFFCFDVYVRKNVTATARSTGCLV